MTPEKLQAFINRGGAVSEREDYRTNAATPGADRSRIGIAAQHLVAYDILMRGYNCSISAEHLAYDLIADIKGLRRVQVKARAFAFYRGRRSTEAAYQFNGLDPDSVDLFAFVALPERLVIYQRASTITANFVIIRAPQFNDDAAQRSWRESTTNWTQPRRQKTSTSPQA